jgi:hypothetical protein
VGATQPTGAGAPSSWALQESQVEGSNHQDNADIHHQPWPELMPEEQQIHDNDTGCHHQDAKHHIGIPGHFNHPLDDVSNRCSMELPGSPLGPLELFLFSTATWAAHEDGCDRELAH